LAVFTTGTNGAQRNKIRIALCFSRVPVCRVTIFLSRKPGNGMSGCGSIVRRSLKAQNSAAAVEEVRPRLAPAFSRVLDKHSDPQTPCGRTT
jgi:hypothetical protein